MVRRDSARVLPVSPTGDVLVLRELDPSDPDRPYWSSIGGGIDPGESPAQAAVRELREEAGIEVVVDDLIGPVHREWASFSWSGEAREGENLHYALRCAPDVDAHLANLEPEEVETVLAATWWHPDDLDGAPCRPTNLPDIMRAAIEALREER